MQTRIIINGRFLSRPASGVQRVAHQMADQMARIAEQLGSSDLAIELALPAAARKLAPSAFSTVRVGKLNGHVFEQLELGRMSPDAWLYSPCNTGPIFRRRQLVTIHDAQIFSVPQAYSRAFRGWYRFMLSLLGKNARLVTTVSDFSRAQLAQYGVAPQARISVVPNGADHIDLIDEDPGALDRLGLAARDYILAIGSPAPHKNLSMLALAATGSQTNLVIVGASTPKVFAPTGLDQSPNIRLLGRVSDRELKALYKNALALAFPSITEGFGLPPLEAMRCGCPVIASTGGAIPQICGDAALFVDPHDVAGWSNAMEKIRTDTALRAELIEKGYARSAQFTWRRAALDILSLIAEADGNRSLAERLAQARTMIPQVAP